MSLQNWLKTDNLTVGIILGLLVPVPAALIFALMLRLIQLSFHVLETVHMPDMLLLGVGINLVIMRYYIKNLRFENTTKGIILVTFIIVVLFFLFLRKINFTFPF